MGSENASDRQWKASPVDISTCRCPPQPSGDSELALKNKTKQKTGNPMIFIYFEIKPSQWWQHRKSLKIYLGLGLANKASSIYMYNYYAGLLPFLLVQEFLKAFTGFMIHWLFLRTLIVHSSARKEELNCLPNMCAIFTLLKPHFGYWCTLIIHYEVVSSDGMKVMLQIFPLE